MGSVVEGGLLVGLCGLGRRGGWFRGIFGRCWRVGVVGFVGCVFGVGTLAGDGPGGLLIVGWGWCGLGGALGVESGGAYQGEEDHEAEDEDDEEEDECEGGGVGGVGGGRLGIGLGLGGGGGLGVG